MKRIFRIEEDSLQDKFQKSHAKVIIFGGGFANGKTASAVIKALQLAREYPTSNGLIARSTYPKLNDTIRKEFLKWCPEHWIKSFPMSANASNTCVLTNGTTINFRYIAQQGKSTGEATTSNLLSATYDWIIADQMEDPEIVEKDFDDLLGRMRGTAPYIGDDPMMPATGPRQFIITLNPTRNWCYRKLVKPLHEYIRTGKRSEKLLWDKERNAPLIELFEGSTYTNRANLPSDFISTLESSYQGQMRERYLLGKWAAYEGLVYAQFDEDMHVISYIDCIEYLRNLRSAGYRIPFIEGFDYGMAVPSCYLFGFTDHRGNTIILDGFYQSELSPDEIFERIKTIRQKYAKPDAFNGFINADPAIFRRSLGDKRTVGSKLSDMFYDADLAVTPGQNDIIHGITKVNTYLNTHKHHSHPTLGTSPAPYLYVADSLQFWIDEISDYYWNRRSVDQAIEDKPKDRDDHAMDTTKYMLSLQPDVADIIEHPLNLMPGYMSWHEQDIEAQGQSVRHG